MSWRIVDTDNFGGDYPNEKFLAWVDAKGSGLAQAPIRFFSEDAAKEIVEILNRGSSHSTRYRKVVPVDYKLV